jgi:hypothetical protein
MGPDGEIRPLIEDDGSATDAVFLSWWPDKAEVVRVLQQWFGSRVVDDGQEWSAIEIKAVPAHSQFQPLGQQSGNSVEHGMPAFN